MSAFTKQVPIAIAVTLGIALSIPLSIPALAESAPANTAMQSAAPPPLGTGDLVRVRSGGPLMTVTSVHGDQVNCSWTDWVTGRLESESFPITVLGVPVTGAPRNPYEEQVE